MFTQTRIVLAILVGAVCFTPVTAKAQMTVKARAPNTALTRAIELHDSALALYSQPSRAAEAARLHVRETSFRSAHDPEAVEALIMAANLFNYAGQPVVARKTMERAAVRALAMGDVVTAAEAYTNAAFLAHKINNKSETQRLGRKAILLSESPLLQVEHRLTIRNRFRVIPTFAELVR
jgi:hypothetical protein